MSTEAHPDPKTWKADHGSPCLRCIKGKLVRRRATGKTEAGAELVLSDQLECPDCGWKHTLAPVRHQSLKLARVRR